MSCLLWQRFSRFPPRFFFFFFLSFCVVRLFLFLFCSFRFIVHTYTTAALLLFFFFFFFSPLVFFALHSATASAAVVCVCVWRLWHSTRCDMTNVAASKDWEGGSIQRQFVALVLFFVFLFSSFSFVCLGCIRCSRNAHTQISTTATGNTTHTHTIEAGGKQSRNKAGRAQALWVGSHATSLNLGVAAKEVFGEVINRIIWLDFAHLKQTLEAIQ